MSLGPIDATIILGADTTMLKEEIKETVQDAQQAEKLIKRSIQSALSTTRRALQMTSLFLGAAGVAVDQTLLQVGEAIVLAAEGLTAVAAAESLTLVGAVTAGVRLVAAGALILQAININRGRVEISSRFAQLSSATRALSDVL